MNRLVGRCRSLVLLTCVLALFSQDAHAGLNECVQFFDYLSSAASSRVSRWQRDTRAKLTRSAVRLRLRTVRINDSVKATPPDLNGRKPLLEAIAWAKESGLTFPEALKEAIRTKSPHMYALSQYATTYVEQPSVRTPHFSLVIPDSFEKIMNYAFFQHAPTPVLVNLLNNGFKPSYLPVLERNADLLLAAAKRGLLNTKNPHGWPKRWLRFVPRLLELGYVPNNAQLEDWVEYPQLENPLAAYFENHPLSAYAGLDFLDKAAKLKRRRILEVAFKTVPQELRLWTPIAYRAIENEDVETLRMLDARTEFKMLDAAVLARAVHEAKPKVVRFLLEEYQVPIGLVTERDAKILAVDRNNPRRRQSKQIVDLFEKAKERKNP